MKLFDTDTLADDEEMVPLEISTLDEDCVASEIKDTVEALVKKHGALKAAEMIVAAEQDLEESEEEEEGEEEDCEEEAKVQMNDCGPKSVGKADDVPARKKARVC